MRVLIVQHGLFPGFVAPIPKEVAKHLSRIGVDVTVASVGGSLSSNGEVFAFPVDCVPAGPPWRTFSALKPLADRADIVHYFPGSGLEWLPMLNRRARYIFNFISVSVSGRRVRDGMINLGKRLQPSLAHLALYTDPALARHLRPAFSVPVELLPVGYPSDLFYPCPPYECDDVRWLIYHGVCRAERRLDRLIRMMPLLPARYRLMIIGGSTPADEAYRRELKTLAAGLGCEERVVLTAMPQVEIRAQIARAYLCLAYVPRIECYEDQFVLKTLECLACARPVLGTSTRHHQRFQAEIGADRLLLSDDTPEALASTIAASEPFVGRFNEASRLASLKEAMTSYSTAAIIEQRLLPMYSRLLKAA